jgi:hypothetical protein
MTAQPLPAPYGATAPDAFAVGDVVENFGVRAIVAAPFDPARGLLLTRPDWTEGPSWMANPALCRLLARAADVPPGSADFACALGGPAVFAGAAERWDAKAVMDPSFEGKALAAWSVVGVAVRDQWAAGPLPLPPAR